MCIAIGFQSTDLLEMVALRECPKGYIPNASLNIIQHNLSLSTVAHMAELVDATDLKSVGFCRAGSTPAVSTNLCSLMSTHERYDRERRNCSSR